MRILIVSPIPVSYPPKDGYSMVVIWRSYFLKKLAGIESDIIVVDRKDRSIENLAKSGIFIDVFSYKIKNKWKSLIKSFFSPYSYTMLRHDISYRELMIIKEKITSNDYDAFIFDYSASYPLYEKFVKYLNIDPNKAIYWAHNIDYVDYKNVALETNNLFKKGFYYLIYKKLRKVEPEYVKKFNKIVSVANHEVNYLKEINPKAKVYWIPPILPEPYFNDMKNKENESNLFNKLREKLSKYRYRILFTGDLKRASNTIACLWFAKEVFPIIKKNLDACFIMVGKNPSKEIIDLAKQEDIFVFSNVPTMKPFYEISDLVVVPLLNPAGIKLKLLEALQYRKKVVARPEALLGAGLENIIPNSSNPQEFAKICIDALEERIDYKPIWKKYDEIYKPENIIKVLADIIKDG